MRAAAVTVFAVASWLAGASLAHAGCTVSATSVAFGTYNVFNTGAVDSTGTVSFYCDKKEKHLQIALGRGGETTFDRKLRQSGEALSYNLYLDATRTTVWGDTTGGTTVYSTKPKNKEHVTVTVYARLPAGQDVGVGNYSDSIVVTMLF
jgi:spore coat protein U-like protein